MEHLIYVLWHDHWKPWLKDAAYWVGHTLLWTLGLFIAGFGMIWATIMLQDAVVHFVGN